jgi:hypothetical protein
LETNLKPGIHRYPPVSTGIHRSFQHTTPHHKLQSNHGQNPLHKRIQIWGIMVANCIQESKSDRSYDMDYLQRLLKQVTCPVLLYYGNKRRVWERTNGANGTWSPKNFKDSKNPVRSYELPPNVRISLVRLQGHAVQHSKVLLAFYEDLIDVMVLTREFGDGNHDDMTWHDSFPQKMQGVPIGTI